MVQNLVRRAAGQKALGFLQDIDTAELLDIAIQRS
jgi:hypothetical protein